MWSCSRPTTLTSVLTDEGYDMKMKYVSVINDYREKNYFYLIPELNMPKIADNFIVQIYTQVIVKTPLNQKPGLYTCLDGQDAATEYETVALTAIVKPEYNICKQSWFLQQYKGTNEIYEQPGNWKNANKADLDETLYATSNMLFGWDATESHSTLVESKVTDEETGET